MAYNPLMPGTRSSSVAGWSSIITLAAANSGCEGLTSLYTSRGSQILVGSNLIDSFNDGPERVVMYDDLTVGDGTTATELSTSYRCKGLTVIVKGNLRVRNNASLHMNYRSPYIVANNIPFFPFVDYKIPFKVSLASSKLSLSAALALIRDGGYAPWDSGLWAVYGNMLGVQCSVVQDGTATLIPATSLASVSASVGGYTGGPWYTASPGTPATNGSPGGGGGGSFYSQGNYNLWTSRGGGATPYGGGAGGSGNHCQANSEYYAVGGPGVYSMPSFGCVYSPPVGYAGGGKLTIIVCGTTTIDSGGKIEANGSAGSVYGGAGGGSVFIIYKGTYSNLGTVQALGGSGAATGGLAGSQGGQGGSSTPIWKTFGNMGW